MKWLLYGITAALLFGFWGLFDKLSSFQSPFVSNAILYFTALFVAVIFILSTKKIKFSKYSLFAGIFAGIGNFFILYALLKNLLILVMPFVSAASVIFFMIIYFTEKPKYTSKQKVLASSGIILSFIGIAIISTGNTGFTEFLKELIIDFSYIIPAIIVMFSFSLWTFFTYKSVSREKIDAKIYNFWNLLASFVSAVVAVLVFSPETINELFSLSNLGYIYPALAGICVAGGTFFTYRAFKTTTTKTKLQEAMVAILANGELIPLLFLSYFILGEKIAEGFIGAIIVLIGLIAIHYAEVSK